MTVRRMTDGRLFYGKADLDKLPDYDRPCPQCCEPWEDHEGQGAVALMRLRSGEAGYVMPSCLQTCSCCHRRVRLVTTLAVGAETVFCEQCRPAAFDDAGDPVTDLVLPSPCPHM